LQVSMIFAGSLVSKQIGHASIFANSLKSSAFPSITGREARGPISPSPRTAEPSVITATEFPFEVSLYAASGSSAMISHGRATPGV
jgi:hypothetical protein